MSKRLRADDEAANAGRHMLEAEGRAEIVAEHADPGDDEEARPIARGDAISCRA